MATTELDRETILRAVETWPEAERIALAQAILAQTAPQPPQPEIRSTWDALYGIAAVPGQPPPSDEQLAQWLDERRTRKYGGA